MRPATVGPYKVLHELGRGGMGVVCKAHDVRLGRDVALKFLPPSATLDPRGKEQLINEARAASRLDHPNICTLHEIEETPDGELVIVMAFYEGQTLAERIAREPVRAADAVEIERQILSALAHAHERGVIHRDIKPSNIILNHDGRLKIVDFGLARLMSADGGSLTQESSGTPAYMDPETISGKTLDHRADLWSCGVVLFEMLAGKPPFTGPTVFAIVDAISRHDRRQLCELRPDLPPRLYQVAERALARELKHRYGSAAEFLEDLAEFESPAPISTRVSQYLRGEEVEKSLVVLPFLSLGNQTDSECFSDGLTDEIITDLSGIHGVRVICRTSAMRLKNTQKSSQEIAAELKVNYVLEGTVRIIGSQLRVNAKLVDGASDSTLWAEKFAGSLEDVFTIQEDISRRIVDALKVKLTDGEAAKLKERPIDDIRAYEYYIRARRELLSYSRPSLESALAYIEKGEQLIGENILLLSARGYVHWQFVNAGIDGDPVHLRIASECAQRILELQPDSAHGHRLLGLVCVHEGKTQEAVQRLRRSLDLAPGDPDSMAWMCALAALSGKGPHVAAMASRLVEIDPLTTTYHFMPGFVAMLSGDFKGAIAPFEKALAGEPANQMLRLGYGHVLLMNGRAEDAKECFESLAKDMPGDLFATLGLVLRAGLMRDAAELRSVLTPEIAGAVQSDMNYAWFVAQGWALAGETDEALTWLESATERGFINYPMLQEHDPTLNEVRLHPRFAKLIHKVKKLWESFTV